MTVVSTEAKNRIMQAVDQTTNLVDQGMHPTHAVLKAAQALDLSPGTGEIVAKAFNIGRTTVQREDNNDDTLLKVAEFELADTEYIRMHLTHQQQKQAQLALEIDASYFQPPSKLKEMYHDQKVAQYAPLEVVKLDALPKFDDNRFLHAASDMRKTQRKIAQSHEVIDQMSRQVERTLNDLCSLFARNGAPSVERMNKIASIKGDTALLCITKELTERRPLLAKRADVSKSAILTDMEQLCYDKLHKCAEDMLQLHAALNTHNKIVELGEARIVKQARQFVNKSDEPFCDLLDDADAETMSKMAASPLTTMAVWSSLLRNVGAMGGAKDTSNDDINYYVAALSDPNHDRQLQAIRARTVLESLMHSDPVLSSYHPNDVVDSYNAIVGMAPRVAEHQPYLQSMMRKYLAQGKTLSPDDIKSNVFDANKAILQGQNMHDEGKITGTKTPKPSDRLSSALGTLWTDGLDA